MNGRLSKASVPRDGSPVVIPEHVAQRALDSFKADERGCHISTYSTGSHGYAQIGWQSAGMARSRMTTAHRAAWTAVHGQIPLGMTVDHTCYTRQCVNPAHLRLLTNMENASDNGWVDGRLVRPRKELVNV